MNTNEAHESLERLPEHAPRLDWAKLAPEAFKAMVRLDTAAKQGVEPVLLNLVKIRASQINHCAFCLDMHSKDALAAGESAERIFQLDAWRESKHFYTAKEIAAIELTEAVTVLTDGFVPDEVYARAADGVRRDRAGPPHRRDHHDQRMEPLRRLHPPRPRPLHPRRLTGPERVRDDRTRCSAPSRLRSCFGQANTRRFW